MSRTDALDSDLNLEIANLRQQVSELESQLSEFEHVRKTLKEEHSFRKCVIERAAEGICACHYIAKYPYLRFTLWNPRMKEITGYTMEQINRIGWYQTMYPDPNIQEMARQRMVKMRRGEDLLNERWKIIRSDGEERMLGISTSILKTQDDRVHVLAMMQDITEQEKYREHVEDRITTLEGLLSICASCKRIQTEKGRWEQLETYISTHSKAKFSHGICPDCRVELYPEI